MSAFLKIDHCTRCAKDLPWEWTPPIQLGNKTLAGTGVWRSTLTDGLCPRCFDEAAQSGRRERYARSLRDRFIDIVGGVVPYRDFTFERYHVEPGNRTAFERAKAFDPAKENLYLWGQPGVGKTHLAVVILRRWFGLGSTVFTTLPKLIRRTRMRAPDEEQRVIDECVHARVFVLDDLALAQDASPYTRQLLQEILDRRAFREDGGLVVTSGRSLRDIAHQLKDHAIPSRLEGMCHVIEILGPDHRTRPSTPR